MTRIRRPKLRYPHRVLARFAEEERELPPGPRCPTLRYRPPRRTLPPAPYGFRVASGNRLVPEPAEQAVIAQIVACWHHGWQPVAIVAELERDHLTMRGQRWRASTVTQLIKALRIAPGSRRWTPAEA